jgi:hypothetical protein
LGRCPLGQGSRDQAAGSQVSSLQVVCLPGNLKQGKQCATSC